MLSYADMFSIRPILATLSAQMTLPSAQAWLAVFRGPATPLTVPYVRHRPLEGVCVADLRSLFGRF